MPMKISERFAAMAEVPTQIKAITVISVSAVIIAVIAVLVAISAVRHGS